jgi:hypothetical protein
MTAMFSILKTLTLLLRVFTKNKAYHSDKTIILLVYSRGAQISGARSP